MQGCQGHGSALPAICISCREWDNAHRWRKDSKSCRARQREQGLRHVELRQCRPSPLPIRALIYDHILPITAALWTLLVVIPFAESTTKRLWSCVLSSLRFQLRHFPFVKTSWKWRERD
jgi:hypothetical protein